MTRHGLQLTAAAHHAFWATERRVLPSQQRKTPGQTISLMAFRQGSDPRETMLIRHSQDLPHRQRWLARTTPKPFSP